MYTALLIDGGHLRVCFGKANIPYTAENIAAFSNQCFAPNETVYRIFYYDAPHYDGEQKKPISREVKVFRSDDTLLNELAKMDNFAIRKGRLKWSGWKIRNYVLRKMTEGTFTDELQDRHFQPSFAQKGVDMVLGLDVAAIAETGRVDQFMLLSADTDMAPALKFGRVHGMRAVLVKPEYEKSFSLHPILRDHADIVRSVDIPKSCNGDNPSENTS